MDELIGKSLSQFRILGKLGQGGMGVVYEARDEKLMRTVALKVLPRDFADDEGRRRRFLREARSAAAVTHPNIATVHEVGEVDGRIYIAMELVDGRSLRRVLESGPLGVRDAIRIARAIARGLAKAHEKGLVHRDLKPDNVMITDDADVKVLDFGVAKSIHAAEPLPATVPEPRLKTSDAVAAPAQEPATNTLATEAGRLVGTPAYMAPEQAIGGTVDARADIFSLGVVLYEMVTGTRPFKAATSSGLLVAMACDAPEPPSKRNPRVWPELDRVIARCLAKKPEDRYASARELARVLEELDGSAPSLASSSGSFSASAVAAAPVPTLVSPDTLVAAAEPDTREPTGAPASATVERLLEAPLTRARSRRGRTWALAISVAVGAGIAAALLARGPGPSPAASVATASAAATQPVDAAPTPTALTDLPPPSTSSPQALVAYRAALQAFRDGNFEAFDAGIREAVRLDPAFPAGQLRLAFAKFHSVRGAVTDARTNLQNAARQRAQLSPHDQILLDVLEPVINREPPDSDELLRVLRAGVDRFPLDAELLYLLANEERRYDIDASLRTYERLLAVDDRFMTALRQKAQTQGMRGDFEGARRSLDLCLERVPGATGCRNERIWLAQDEGRCEAIEDDARHMIAADPESYRGYEALALAGVALGRPREAIDVLLQQAWQRAPGEVRARNEVRTNAHLAVLAGRFDEARELGKRYEALVASDSSAQVHASVARLLVELDVETGDVRAAAHVAGEFLKRQVAWSGAPDRDTARMLRVQRLAGVLDDAEYRAARGAFIEAWSRQSSRTRFMRGVAWLLGYAAQVESKEDADEAMRELPKYGDIPVGQRTAFNDEAVGRARLYAGSIAEAIAPLTRASRMCTAIDEPFHHVRAELLLGEALDAKGDKAGACRAYASVVKQWGRATPRSTTADRARARARKLGCAL